MAFQQDTLTTPLHSYVFFHILLFSVITLQMKWLTMKGLTRCWTLPLHSWRTSVVWLTDGLDVWQTDCGEVWTGILWGGKAGKNLSCLLGWHGNTQEDRGTKEGGEREGEWNKRDRNLCFMRYVDALMHVRLMASALHRARVICCVLSQLPSALYLCEQAQICCCVH